jgi:hypothetical protein
LLLSLVRTVLSISLFFFFTYALLDSHHLEYRHSPVQSPECRAL